MLACELCFSIDKEDEYSRTWDGQNQKLNLAIKKPIKKPINPLGGEIEKGEVLKYAMSSSGTFWQIYCHLNQIPSHKNKLGFVSNLKLRFSSFLWI